MNSNDYYYPSMAPPSTIHGIDLDTYYAFTAISWICAVVALSATVLLMKSLDSPLRSRAHAALHITGLCIAIAGQAGIVLMYVLGLDDRSHPLALMLLISAVITIGLAIRLLVNRKRPAVLTLGVLTLILSSGLIVATSYGFS